MKAILFSAVLVLAGCAHHLHVAKKPPPPVRMSPATSSAVVTGEPRAMDEDSAAVQTTGAEIHSHH